ncbi:hypothetical protein V1599_20860 [Enterobacter sp. ECC-175]|uniref:CIS tube protein n=1 Tax=unclassified Enterobacter TaxID=2608935 RepID=UPI000D3F0C09|nr:hypothetical protein [Enterobacter sp. RIT 418]RAU29885.1 hypothetical protein DBY73_021565 [Enterobacter sp. RIT 418]
MSLINQLKSRKIEKLTIRAFADNRFKVPISIEGITIPATGLVLPFNPENLQASYGTKIKELQALGPVNEEGDGPEKIFVDVISRNLSFNFLLDATLPANIKLDITKIIKTLEACCYSIHKVTKQPPFIEMRWGGEKFRGRMLNMHITRTLFSEDGKPLQANVSMTMLEDENRAVFKEGIPVVQTATLPIPDMPVLATLLALMDGAASVNYVQAAMANDLDNLHALMPGSMLILDAR